MERLKNLAARLGHWWKESFIGRVVARFSDRNGSIFASGLAYGLLFAFFAGLWSLFSVFGLLFSNNDGFRDSLLSLLDTVVPGLVSGSNSILSEDTLSSISTTFTVTGLFTLIAFWWKITSWLGSLRSATHTILGEDDEGNSHGNGTEDPVGELDNPIRARLIDTAAVLIVAVLFLLTSFAGVLSGGLVSAVMRVFGWLGTSWLSGFLISAAGFIVAVALNMLLLVTLFRVVCQIRRMRMVLLVSLLGGVVLGIIQLLGGRLLTGASSNPLLAPFATLLTVLIWFNIIAMVLMYCSAIFGELIFGEEEKEEAARAAALTDKAVNTRVQNKELLDDRGRTAA